MKKRISLLMILCITISIFTVSTEAVSAYTDIPDDVLIIVGGKAVKEDMTDKDVINLFGEPKLKTPSPFGGYAYTFYNNNYSDHLYIETTESGEIASYCSVANDFITYNYSYGDKFDEHIFGSVLTKSNKDLTESHVYGILEYNNNVIKIAPNNYNNLLLKDPYAYITALNQHTVLLFNAASANTPEYSKGNELYYDEEALMECIKLGEQKTNVNEYADINHLDGYVKSYNFSTDFYLTDDYINPMQFVSHIIFRYTIPKENSAVAFTYYNDDSCARLSYCCINPEVFNVSYKEVELTAEEASKIEVMNQMYLHSVNTYNSTVEYFDTDPDYSSIPIKEGVVNQNKLDAAAEYLNLIRYGAGLEPLTLDNKLCHGAQAKAAYVRYIVANDIPYINAHIPPQVDGVSDEFYNLCMSGGGENLFWGNVLTSITNALDDSYGDPIFCGHRYNLLNPNYTHIGLGSVEEQGTHKFSGYQKADVDFVAWPSDGVTPKEGIRLNTFYWTFNSYNDDYYFTDDTEVTITLLNTGKEWIFNKDTGLYRYHSLLSFGDRTLSVSENQVYSITIKNISDKSTGKTFDYTYRSVIADISNPNISTPETHKSGDLDLDGSITIKDATLLQKHLANLITLNSEQLALADANKDSNINISDCTQIQKFLASLINTL